MRLVVCLLLVLLGLTPAFAQQTASQWVWYPEQPASECLREDRWFRTTFDLPEKPKAASLWLIVDDSQRLWINGQGPLQPLAGGEPHVLRFDVAALLQRGRNVLALIGWNSSGPAGVIARLTATMPDGKEVVVTSDASWRAVKAEPVADWVNPAFDDSAWRPVRVLGSAFLSPWYDHELFNVRPFITPDEARAYQAHRDTLLAPADRFAAEQAARAAIKPYHGAPALFIDGKPRPLVMYRASLDPFTDYGRHLIASFRDAGIHGYAPYVALDRCWLGPGKYNWKVIDEQVRAYLSVDPDAYLDILVRLVPPEWWFQAHPGEMVEYATSDQRDSSDEAGRVLRPSPASEVWRQDVGHAWTELIKHMEAQPWGKRVIGWHACYGIYAEWHYFGSWTQQYPDIGPAMTRVFRRWLEDKYGTVDKLRAAWRDSQITFADAAVPGVEPRRLARLGALRDPQFEQSVIDYYRCQHQVTADAIEYFGKLAKEASGGRALYGIYYGYFMGVHPQAQGGHLDLLRLLKSPYIDYFVAPYDYGNRLMGMDGRLRSLSMAFNLAGKAHIIEADTRTYLHPREEYGRTQNLTESLAAIRREFSTGLIEHTGYWYVDFGPEGVGGWFDQPQLMSAVKALYQLAERVQSADRRSVSEVALVCDLDSAYYLSDGQGMATAYGLIMATVEELYRTGTPFDAFLLPQLPEADLSRYKVLIFLNTTAMSNQQAAFLQTLRESGKHTLVFLWAPGYTGPDGASLARVQQATGFQVAFAGDLVSGTMLITQPDVPLTRGLPTSLEFHLAPSASNPVSGFDDSQAWFNPRSALQMESSYERFDWERVQGGVQWTFATKENWSDIHWKREFTPGDGLGVDFTATRPAAATGKPLPPQLSVQCVIKDANDDEFVSPPTFLADTKLRQVAYPLRAYTNAPWAVRKPPAPALPARGMKFVVYGVGGGGQISLQIQNLRCLTGAVSTRTLCRFGEGVFGPAFSPVAGPGTRVLGHIEDREACLLAIRGQGPGATLFCPTPYLPRQILANLFDESAVWRYDTNPQDILRSDSRLLAIHTKEGGLRTLRLPQPTAVRDALTGLNLGQGTTLPLTLEPNSTTILELKQVRT